MHIIWCIYIFLLIDIINLKVINLKVPVVEKSCALCGWLGAETDMLAHAINQHCQPDMEYFPCPLCKTNQANEMVLETHIDRHNMRSASGKDKWEWAVRFFLFNNLIFNYLFIGILIMYQNICPFSSKIKIVSVFWWNLLKLPPPHISKTKHRNMFMFLSTLVFQLHHWVCHLNRIREL